MGAIELPENIKEQLLALPETGMDFQTGDIWLSNGQLIKDCIFVSGHVTKVHRNKDPFFKPNEILSVHLTHEKWRW